MKTRRRHEPAVEAIGKHELAAAVMHAQGLFFRIKTISASGEIDRMCVDGIAKLSALTGAAEIQKQLDELRARQLDPTG